MRLLEYEAKELLESSGLPVASGQTIKRADETVKLPFPLVLKSQVPVGGRGKLGGIVFANDSDEYAKAAAHLFGHEIKGHLPKAVLVEEKLSIEWELYLSLLIDREESRITVMAHAAGGVDIESQDTGWVALPIDADDIPATDIAAALKIPERMAEVKDLLRRLFTCFVKNDATMIEINPLALTADGRLVCSDAKIELDDAAAFRHDWRFETEAAEANFVTLNPHGNVATIANGAGLAMATVDAAFEKGLAPANFLDIGGGANTASIVKAFERIMDYPDVKAIIINIFAGITRCDEVAKAIIEAKSRIAQLPPLYIRLAGTNYEAAAELLVSKYIPINATLDDCLAQAAAEVLA